MKVAICTSNGKHVDLHFGKTSTFYIYEIDHQTPVFQEKRDVEAYCPQADIKPTDQHAFNVDTFQNVYQALEDCERLYTVAIGDKPKAELRNKGMRIYLCNCPVDNIPTCEGKCKA